MAARGELPLPNEEDKEIYCVDFFYKTIEQEESQQPEAHVTTDGPPQEKEAGSSDEVLLYARPFGLGCTSSTLDSYEHKHFASNCTPKNYKRGQRKRRLLEVTATAEVEETESTNKEDGFEAVKNAKEEVIEEGEAEEVGALPPPGCGPAELPRPAVSPTPPAAV
ncbi:hypothetical protein Cni_G00211 [Canna indica]|uniref:Uncharacterized protein n=1 Tax=Canna indica TaxID=4628 RepID=A0AAQ3JM28_9LILI|nr:hypothetical protein Cni_G00211 [Canna indica]